MNKKSNELKKSERFAKVAENRTEKVLMTLRSLAKCSNTNSYHYTQRQINKIFRAIKHELKACEASYSSKSGRNGKSFKF